MINKWYPMYSTNCCKYHNYFLKYTFQYNWFIYLAPHATFHTNGKISKNLSDRKKYILEVVKKFNDLSVERSNISKKTRSLINDLFDKNDNESALNLNVKSEYKHEKSDFPIFTSKAHRKNERITNHNVNLLQSSLEVSRTVKENERNRISKSGLNDQPLKDCLDSEYDFISGDDEEKLKKLIHGRDIVNSVKLVRQCISSYKLPQFSIIKDIAYWASKKKEFSLELDAIIEIAKLLYSDNFIKEQKFQHFVCEERFLNGHYKSCFQILERLFTEYRGSTQNVNAVCFMLSLSESSKPWEVECLEMVSRLMYLHKNPSAAYTFWKVCLRNKGNLHQFAWKLVNDFPSIFVSDGEFVIMEAIDVAFSDMDSGLLQTLTEMCLKTGAENALCHSLSCSLSLYCMLEDYYAAKEVFNYIKKQKILISSASMRQYLSFLHKKKLPTSFSALSVKYGLKRKKVNSPTENTTPKFKF